MQWVELTGEVLSGHGNVEGRTRRHGTFSDIGKVSCLGE